MTKDELIAKQQLEIESLKVESTIRRDALSKIVLRCVCIGGPLNDNIGGYTHKQKGDFQHILSIAEEAIHCTKCE